MSAPADGNDLAYEGYQERIDELLGMLSSPNGRLRQQAREELVGIGRPAIPALVQALDDRSWRVRWEATKALEELADPSTTNVLLALLEDEAAEVRWVAAEGLAAIGWLAIPPLLSALVTRAGLAYFRAGAHYVLRTLEERGVTDGIEQVLDALEGPEPSIEVPIAAEEALVRLMGVFRPPLP